MTATSSGMSESELRRWGQWIIDTCLRFGAQPETAYQVAWHFVAGLRKERPAR